ncbi:MAG: hypothetical protein EA400_02935 [Chromatiaceae bacterium]|nr:MAG: hypothetical protein EA400_02935 [Chromatiaceae bacterium]
MPYHFFHSATSLAIGATASLLLLAGCGGSPGEDVRVTLCKDIVAVQAGGAVSIQSASAQTRGYQDAIVRVRYDRGGNPGEAICYFPYRAVDDTGQTLADPLSAYGTSPTGVTFDGQPLSGPQLAEAIRQAMLRQGRAAADRARSAVQQAIGR